MIRSFVPVITRFMIGMIICGLIHRVNTYNDFESVFTVCMVEMDQRIYLGKMQERHDQQEGTQFCSLEVMLHGHTDFEGQSLAPMRPWFKSFLSRE